jgi:hypothetical protein
MAEPRMDAVMERRPCKPGQAAEPCRRRFQPALNPASTKDSLAGLSWPSARPLA